MNYITDFLSSIRLELYEFLLLIIVGMTLVGVVYRLFFVRKRKPSVEVSPSASTSGDNSPIMIGSNHKMEINNADNKKERDNGDQ